MGAAARGDGWQEIYVYFMHEPTAPGYAQTLMRARLRSRSDAKRMTRSPQSTSTSSRRRARSPACCRRPPMRRACYVLAHGAGAGMAHPFMAAVAEGLAERGVATLRYQFPYMERGSKRPDAPKLAQATVRAAVAEAGAAAARHAAVRRRQVVRRPHDLAGAGGLAAAGRARPRVPRLSAAPGRASPRTNARRICRRSRCRCCSCRARATSWPSLELLQPVVEALGRARDAAAVRRRRSLLPRARADGTQGRAGAGRSCSTRWRSGSARR